MTVNSIQIAREDDAYSCIDLMHGEGDTVMIWFQGPDGDCSFDFTREQLDDLYVQACKVKGWHARIG